MHQWSVTIESIIINKLFRRLSTIWIFLSASETCSVSIERTHRIFSLCFKTFDVLWLKNKLFQFLGSQQNWRSRFKKGEQLSKSQRLVYVWLSSWSSEGNATSLSKMFGFWLCDKFFEYYEYLRTFASLFCVFFSMHFSAPQRVPYVLKARNRKLSSLVSNDCAWDLILKIRYFFWKKPSFLA